MLNHLRYLSLAAAYLLAALIPLSVSAQPNAGQLLREQQLQQERQQLPAQAKPEVPVVNEPKSTTNGMTVLVKSVRFRGYDGLATEAELQAIVSESIGKSLGLAELQGLAERVTALLRKKGFFLARAYLPKQDVTEGIIEIAIVQAKSEGEVSFNCAQGVRIHQGQLKQVVSQAIKPGQPLHESDLERVLLLMNDIPGVTARAVLAPGSAPGTTRVTINVTEAPLFSGAIWGDNYGNRYTGAWRGNAFFSLNDPFHLGDQLSLMFCGASGLTQGRFAYSVPIWGRGIRANTSYSKMQYKLGKELAPMKGKGTADTLDFGISGSIVRSQSFNLSANIGFEQKNLKDDAYGFNIRDKRLQSGVLGLSGSYVDTLLGGGCTSWNLSGASGYVTLSHNRGDYNSDRGRLVYDLAGDYITIPAAHTSGYYTRANLSVSRLQRITDGLAFYASYSGQLASKNLDSSEKFSLGGPNGVRAYPVGEASGDEGHLFNFELRQDLPWGAKWLNCQVVGFLDAGHITLYKFPWYGAVTNPGHENNYQIAGSGLGLNFGKPGLYSVRLSYAHKLGENSGRSYEYKDVSGNVIAGGKDADGLRDSSRLWLMGQLSF